MSNSILEVKNISFSFTIRHGSVSTLKETLVSLTQKKPIDLHVDAICDVSLDIKRGEIIAVVGSNGSGKTTLLKLIGGILNPTHGHLLINGKVATIVDLGDCFNHDLTGYENLILLGVILGNHSMDMKKRVSSIISWCELEDVIHQPMRTYSSGMIARLAVAIFTDSRPDLLVLDEVLSVVDNQFAKKAMARIRDFNKLGSAIVLVSHDLKAIKEMAHKALWIDHGRCIRYGDVDSVVDAYLNA